MNLSILVLETLARLWAVQLGSFHGTSGNSDNEDKVCAFATLAAI